MIKHFPCTTKNRCQESQRIDMHQFFSKQRQIAKSRRHGSRDIPAKSPPTPNLEWLKQQKMNKQNQPSSKIQHNRHKSPINTLQQSAENGGEEENDVARYYCVNHPDKRSKYFLARDMSVRLCTVCAINYNQLETVLDEEKLHKTNDISSLKEMIKMVKNMIPEREQEINRQARIQDDLFKLVLEVLDNEFEMIFRSVQQKHNQLVDYVHNKHRQYTIHLESEKSVIPMVSKALQKYTFDIDKNYEQIINELSVPQFDNIMKQYRAKISDYTYKLDTEFEELINVDLIKGQVTDVTARIKNLTFERSREFGNGLLKPMQKKGENKNYLNILKAKTPDRHDRFN